MRAPSKAYVRELQVGIFILIGCLILAAFSFKITDSPVFRRGTVLTLYLSDATGIFVDSKVKMAGINIGAITSIKLEDGRARIQLVIDRGIQIPKDSQIIPRALGILGDKYLDVSVPAASRPSVAPSGNGPASEGPAEADGPQSRIFNFFEKGAHAQGVSPSPPSMNGEGVAIDASQTPDAPVAGKAPNPAAVIRRAARKVYRQGDVVKGVDANNSLDDLTRQMGVVSQDLKDISGNLKKLVRDNQSDVTTMIHSMAKVAQKLESTVNGFDQRQLERDMKDLSRSVGNMSQTIKNAESITSKIDRGDGTIAKLINDPTTANELNRALATINATVEKARRTLVTIDMTSEYNFAPRSAKTYVGVSLQPREDTAYIGQVIIDSVGTTRKTVFTTTPLDGTTAPTSTQVITNDRTDVRFSLQYQKRVGSFALRIGLFENRGGAGMDYFLFRDQLVASADLFDFSRDNNRPHLKIGAQFRFLSHFYVSAGGDDLLAKNDGHDIRSSVYAGVGLRFTDDDIKTLLILPGVH